jgi:hypothetical protein
MTLQTAQNAKSIGKPCAALKCMGGLGVLHMDKFATTLRLRRPWIEWKDPDKIWARSGNPYTEEVMNIFFAATSIILENGRKTSFWHAPWLDGRKPKDIAPRIFESCKRKKLNVSQALNDDAWVRHANLQPTFSVKHLTIFLEIWSLITNVHLQDEV